MGAGLPCEAPEEISLDTGRRAGSDGSLPISLVLKDGCD